MLSGVRVKCLEEAHVSLNKFTCVPNEEYGPCSAFPVSRMCEKNKLVSFKTEFCYCPTFRPICFVNVYGVIYGCRQKKIKQMDPL